jgi:mannosyltransferase OCH1-like enzyme
MLFDNNMCRIFLTKVYSPFFCSIFDFLQDGPIKADFWRVCVLFKCGGVYVDADIEPLKPIEEFIDNAAVFATCTSYSDNYLFNPNFIVSNKNNAILQNAINWYVKKFNEKQEYDYWGWSIMKCFSEILPITYIKSGVYKVPATNSFIQIIREVKGKTHYDDHNLYKGIRIFNNRYKQWDFDKHAFKENSIFHEPEDKKTKLKKFHFTIDSI